MKISKIASLAILGISLSTSAFANLASDISTAKTPTEKYNAGQSALNIFFKSLDIISSPDNAKLLKDLTDDTLKNNKAIENAFKAVVEMPDYIMSKFTQKSLDEITATVGEKTAKLKITKHTDSKPKIEISVTGVDSGNPQEIISGGSTHIDGKNWDKLFATENKAVLEKLIKETKTTLKNMLNGEEFKKAALNANKAVAKALVASSDVKPASADDAKYIANEFNIIDEAFKEELTKGEYKDKKANEKQELEEKFAKNIAQKAVIDKIAEKITKSDNGLNKTLQEKISSVTGFTSTGFDKTALTLDGKLESQKIAEINQRAQDILNKIETIEGLKKEAGTANAENDDAKKKQAQFNVIKKAVELGIEFKAKDNLTAMTADNVNNYNPNNGSKKEDIESVFGNANTAITTQADNSGTSIATTKAAAKDIVEWVKVYNNAKSVKASLISDYLIAGADNKALAKALSGAVSNEAISEMLTDLDLDKTEKAIESLAKSVREVSDVIANNSVIDGVSFANNLATATRLAKLSNPFNDDLALAYAIKNIKNDSFADNSGDLVNSTIKAYTDRYNNDNNVWGTLIGAKGHIKNAGNPEFYGLSLGYDKRLDNTILGGFVSYAKSKLDTKLVSSEANNYQLGAYSRTFIDNHEIDAKASFTLAKNSLDRTSETTSMSGRTAKPKFLKQNANFDSYLFNLKADYGYVVGIDDTLFLKPTVGLEYSYAKNKEFKESGDIAFNYHGYNSSTLALNAALEIRQYVNNSNFLYFTPGVSTQLYKSNKDLVLNVVGSNVDVTLPVNSSKQTFFTLNTGADIKLTDALSTNINFGVKASSKEQYYNGTLGLKYQF